MFRFIYDMLVYKVYFQNKITLFDHHKHHLYFRQHDFFSLTRISTLLTEYMLRRDRPFRHRLH